MSTNINEVRKALNDIAKNVWVNDLIQSSDNIFFDNKIVFDEQGCPQEPSVDTEAWAIGYMRGTGVSRKSIGSDPLINYMAQYIIEVRTSAGKGTKLNDDICQALMDAYILATDIPDALSINTANVEELLNNGKWYLTTVLVNIGYYRRIIGD